MKNFLVLTYKERGTPLLIRLDQIVLVEPATEKRHSGGSWITLTSGDSVTVQESFQHILETLSTLSA